MRKELEPKASDSTPFLKEKCFSILSKKSLLAILKDESLSLSEANKIFDDLIGDGHSRHHLIGVSLLGKYRAYRWEGYGFAFKRINKIAKKPLNSLALQSLVEGTWNKGLKNSYESIEVANTACLNTNISGKTLADQYAHLKELVEDYKVNYMNYIFEEVKRGVGRELLYKRFLSEILNEITHSPYLTSKELEQLCYSEDKDIREAAAKNINCPNTGRVINTLKDN